MLLFQVVAALTKKSRCHCPTAATRLLITAEDIFWPIIEPKIQVDDLYKPDIQQHAPTVVPQKPVWLTCP